MKEKQKFRWSNDDVIGIIQEKIKRFGKQGILYKIEDLSNLVQNDF